MDPGSCLSCPERCLFRRHLEERAVARLLRDAVHGRFAGRASILYEGEPPLSVRCLSRGHVKEIRAGRRGEDVVLRILGPGTILGLAAVLAEAPHAATIETLDHAEVCTIPAARVREEVGESRELALSLLASLGREIHELQADRIRRTEDSVLRRTAHALLRLSSEAAATVLPLRRTELAQWIGTAPETLSRTLHEMERRGWIELDRVHIAVRDRVRLARAAGARRPGS